MKAIWNGEVVAESDNTVVVERNHYFLPDSVSKEYLKDSATHTVCSWKGTDSYYSLDAGGQENPDATWHYPDPSPTCAIRYVNPYVVRTASSFSSLPAGSTA